MELAILYDWTYLLFLEDAKEEVTSKAFFLEMLMESLEMAEKTRIRCLIKKNKVVRSM